MLWIGRTLRLVLLGLCRVFRCRGQFRVKILVETVFQVVSIDVFVWMLVMS